jgi:hypothetical protein
VRLAVLYLAAVYQHLKVEGYPVGTFAVVLAVNIPKPQKLACQYISAVFLSDFLAQCLLG